MPPRGTTADPAGVTPNGNLDALDVAAQLIGYRTLLAADAGDLDPQLGDAGGRVGAPLPGGDGLARAHRLAVYLIVKTEQGFEARFSPQFAPYLVQKRS